MKLLPTILLLLYLSAVCRPAFPLVADGLAHIFWYEHHLETKHAHAGSHHVIKEIAAESELENGTHNGIPASHKTNDKSSDFLFVHLPTVLLANSFLLKNNRVNNAKYNRMAFGNIFRTVLTPPPDLLG